ncbi:MAG: VWA domain-containing protein [Acidobacteria bacterium]|nr:MAG: VWA domain-containing protein [Acidobacteriota bacterium]
MKRLSYLFCFLWVMFSTHRFPAQDQPKKTKDSDYTLKVDVNLITLHVSVLDERDQIIKGLKKEDFSVYEDKIQQEISLFKEEDVPVSLELVIDNSGSMRTKRERVNRAALTFVRTSNSQDEIFLINFNDQVYIDQDFTRNPDDLRDALEGIDARGGTALYDAIYLSLEHIREGKEDKKALLLISDGEDRDSRYKFESVLEFARESHASIFVIGLFDKEGERSRAQKKAAKALRELAEETGGKYYFPESVDEAEAICTQVAHEIRNQYTLGYKPTNARRDGTWRTVSIKLNNSKNSKKLVARTKRGYYAPTES